MKSSTKKFINAELGSGASDLKRLNPFSSLREEIQKKITGHHIKARTQKPDHYPTRQIDDSIVSFENPKYKPILYASPKIYGNPDKLPSWASPLPQEPEALEKFLSFMDKNPGGPTGIFGPGELGAHINWAADPVVFTSNPKTGEIFQIQIQRSNGEWAIPGGMVDSRETHLSASIRELEEETGVKISSYQSHELFQGYADDYRNTDTHWIQSSVFMFYIPWVKAQNIRFETKDTSEGIQDIQLRKLTQENIATLFASHPEYVKLGLIKLAENLDIICGDLRSEAKVYAEILKLLGGS